MDSGKYGTMDFEDGEFFISSKICLTDCKKCWFTPFITVIKYRIDWQLTVSLTIDNRFAVYFTYDSHTFTYLDRFKGTCHFTLELTENDNHNSFHKQNITRTNYIYPNHRKVSIYTSEFEVKGTNFTFKIYGKMSDMSHVPKLPKFSIDIETIPNLLKNMESFFMAQEFCDVTFQSADICISAHKTILAAQSPVFKCMFSSHMVENRPGTIINVRDVEGEVLKEMFRFMYGGRVENINKIADKLLILANKYDIKSLMTLCEKAFYDKLNICNAITMMKTAESHNATNLRQLIEQFIIQNKKSLLDTAEFKSLVSTNPEIVIDILKAE